MFNRLKLKLNDMFCHRQKNFLTALLRKFSLEIVVTIPEYSHTTVVFVELQVYPEKEQFRLILPEGNTNKG